MLGGRGRRRLLRFSCGVGSRLVCRIRLWFGAWACLRSFLCGVRGLVRCMRFCSRCRGFLLRGGGACVRGLFRIRLLVAWVLVVGRIVVWRSWLGLRLGMLRCRGRMVVLWRVCVVAMRRRFRMVGVLGCYVCWRLVLLFVRRWLLGMVCMLVRRCGGGGCMRRWFRIV